MDAAQKHARTLGRQLVRHCRWRVWYGQVYELDRTGATTCDVRPPIVVTPRAVTPLSHQVQGVDEEVAGAFPYSPGLRLDLGHPANLGFLIALAADAGVDVPARLAEAPGHLWGVAIAEALLGAWGPSPEVLPPPDEHTQWAIRAWERLLGA